MPAPAEFEIPCESQLDPRADSIERERRLLALAECQRGALALHQLRALDLSASSVRRRVARGRLHRVHRGVYVLGRPDLPIEGRWMAAVLACGEGALLSHRSAAALHGLLRGGGASIEVTVAGRRGLSRPGLRVHRPECLCDGDRAMVRGIPTTSVPRTLFDNAQAASPRVLERACDQAEVLRVLDMNAMRELLARREGQPGVRQLRGVLEMGHVGEDIARRDLEERFLRLCRRSDLPSPEVNVSMNLGGEELEVDFLWRNQRVVVEVDGFATHGTRQAFQRDRRRDQTLRLAGWSVVRFTWDDVTKEPRHVMEVVRATLAWHDPD